MLPNVSDKKKDPWLRPGFIPLLLLLAWSSALALSLAWNLHQHRRGELETARTIARSHYDKDMLLRKWNIAHGFVYVPVTDRTPPNPYLALPEREISTSAGKRLTALNSSYLLRQLHQLAATNLEIKGHLTSLTPLRPENGPDPWEAWALHQLSRGHPEVSELKEMNGKPYLRLMRPVSADPGCLKCHTGHGLQPGQVMGGISVSVPFTPLRAAGRQELAALWTGHALIWLLGLAGLGWGVSYSQHKTRARLAAEARLNRQSALLAGINQVFQAALSCDTLAVLAHRCLAVAQEFTASRFGFLGEINQQGRLDTLALSDPGWQACRLPPDQALKLIQDMEIRGLWGRVILDGRPLLTNEPASHPQRTGLPEGHPELTAFLGVPLRYHEQTIGLIALANKEGGYSQEDQEMVESLATAVVEAFSRKRAELQLKDSEAFWKELMDAVGVGVLLIDADTKQIVAANPQAAELAEVAREDMLGRVCHKFICPHEKGQCPALDLNIFECQTEHQLLTATGHPLPILKTVVPISLHGKKYLLESFLDLKAQRQTEEALAQANAQLQNMIFEFGQKNQEARLLGKMGEVLQSCQSLNEAYPIIVQFAQELFPELSGGFFLLNDSENLMAAVGLWGPSFAGEKHFSPQDCWALRRGRPHLLDEKVPRLPCWHLALNPQDASLCVPLLAQGENLGLLVLHTSQETAQDQQDFFLDNQASLSESVQSLAERVAEQVSLSLANLKLRETLHQQAIRDPLTGLFNRRYLQETLTRELHRATRQNAPLGVMFLDIDHFKHFNDTFGHEAGDLVLQTLGNFLKNRVRQEDVACRFGGEEFCIVMPGASPEVVCQRAEELRQGVQLLKVHHNGQSLGDLTVSIGLACFPHQGVTGEALLQAADAALYQAKESGRNRVEWGGRS